MACLIQFKEIKKFPFFLTKKIKNKKKRTRVLKKQSMRDLAFLVGLK